MISDYRCFYCFVRAFEKLLEKENISKEAKNCFTNDMVSLYQNRPDSFISPEFARQLHVLLRSYTLNPDPYRQEKKKYNDLAMNMFPGLQELIGQSSDSFGTALRLGIAGNIIDFAANDNFNLQATIHKALNCEFAIDHSKQLKNAIKKADTILYLGDNAGEIVFDKLFIQTINHHNLTYVVRGAPVINDSTMEDAEYVGMKDIINVISNGYDAPSTIPDKSNKQFQEYFRKADLIISKGQGNLEGLIPLNDDRIFFLLMVKCDVMAEFMKVKKDSFVVYNTSC
ncbi:MAG TPA: ARMT1-like domain-containing protein [Bacteroidales bacterium]|nr:ARMT1-like domain-containing protein [Bacteroidales bacterium]